jgi:hypothetical protein
MQLYVSTSNGQCPQHLDGNTQSAIIYSLHQNYWWESAVNYLCFAGLTNPGPTKQFSR